MSQDEKTPEQPPQGQTTEPAEAREKHETTTDAAAQRAAEAAEHAKTALQDALATFKGMMLNPVAGLGAAHAGIEEKRVLGVGVVFAVLAALGIALAGGLLVTGMMQMMMGMGMRTGFQFGAFVRSFISTLGGIAACGAVIYALAPVFGGRAKLGPSAFIAGATFLPWGIAMLLGSFIGAILSNRLGMILISVLVVFGLCFLILILNAGFRQIAGLDERRAALATPTTLAATSIVIMLIGWLLT
jgi:hypothetical protein